MSENLTLESETAVERKEIAPLSSSDLLQHPASDSKQNRTLNELHLFAGVGGGIIGGILCGHRPVCAVEIEPYARAVLLQRQRDQILPRFPIWDDVRTFDGTPWRGIADVVCEASRAKTSVPQIKTAAAWTKENEADCGKKWQESFARFDQATSSWKTPQCWLIGELEQSSVIWPRWGMMQDGECWELATPDCCTNENECGLLPTPLTNPSRRKLNENGNSVSKKGQRYGVSLAQLAGGEPCPRFQEWLMDWPPGWTATEPLETDKFRLWFNSHGESYDENETALLVL